MSEILIKAKWYSTEEESDMADCDMCLEENKEVKAPNNIEIGNRARIDLCDDHLEKVKIDDIIEIIVSKFWKTTPPDRISYLERIIDKLTDMLETIE